MGAVLDVQPSTSLPMLTHRFVGVAHHLSSTPQSTNRTRNGHEIHKISLNFANLLRSEDSQVIQHV